MTTAADLYLELTGPNGRINGESRVVGFQDQIEVIDWKWQLRHRDSTSAAEPTVFQFSKIMDRASTTMLGHMQKGTQLTADITVQDSSIDNPFILVIHLEDVRVIDYGFNIKVADDQKEGRVEEDWTFDYAKIKFQYKTQDDKGSGRKGTATVEMERPAGASTDSPSGMIEKIMTMSRGLQVGQLEELWKNLEREATRRRLQGDQQPKQQQPKQQQPGKV
jgi:type VI secretion system Hcp family effector